VGAEKRKRLRNLIGHGSPNSLTPSAAQRTTAAADCEEVIITQAEGADESPISTEVTPLAVARGLAVAEAAVAV
jgi:hypothetical protein